LPKLNILQYSALLLTVRCRHFGYSRLVDNYIPNCNLEQVAVLDRYSELIILSNLFYPNARLRLQPYTVEQASINPMIRLQLVKPFMHYRQSRVGTMPHHPFGRTTLSDAPPFRTAKNLATYTKLNKFNYMKLHQF
jgi:hypothetical protein